MESEIVEKAFYNKFGLRAMITFEEATGYGNNFLIWKYPTMSAGQVMYYKIGKTLDTALWFIDMWKYAPSAIATFDEEDDKIMYMSELTRVEKLWEHIDE